MAYTLLATNRWATEPVIDVSLYYDHRRVSGTQQYKFKTVISALQYSTSYYGYKISQTITLDNTVSSADVLKNTSPSHWSSAITYETDWITFQKTSGTVACSWRIYGANGHENTYTYSLAVDVVSSTISIPSTGTLGTAFTISITRYNQSYTDDLVITCGSASETIATGISATSQSCTPPISFAAQSPYYGYVTATVTCTTKDGDTVMGTSSASIKLAIPDSVKPTLSASLTDTTGYYTTYGGYVAGKSVVTLTITPTLAYSSPIMTYSVQYNGVSTISVSNTFTLNISSATTIYISATDARGHTGTLNQTITVLAYSAPQITNLNAYRCDSSGNADDEGDYMKIVGTVTVSPLNDNNSKTYKAIYMQSGGSSYTEIAVTAASYTQNIATSPISIGTGAYVAGLSVTDDFTTVEQTVNVPIPFVLMDFKASGKGIGIGKYSQTDNLLDIAMDVNIDGNLTVNGTYPGGGGGAGVSQTTIWLSHLQWVGNTQTVAVTGITANSVVWTSPTEASRTAFLEADIRATAQSAGYLTFKCTNQSRAEDGDISVVVAWA